jgi:hypothetical protein
MILINLLPEQYHQKKRTPLKFLAAVAASVAINGSLLAYFAWTVLGVAAEVKSELAVLEETKGSLDPQVAYHKELEAESMLFQSREETLKNVTGNRVSWTQEIETLIDVVNAGGEGEKYLIWLDDLTADMKENERAKTYGKIKAGAHSGSADFDHLADFLEDVEESELTQSFNKPAPPSGTAQTKDEDLLPADIWNFTLEMDLRAPTDRTRTEEQAEEAGEAGEAR